MTKKKIERIGTVYLLHFDPPYRQAGHYIGWALDPDARLREHTHGSKYNPLVRAALLQGSRVVLARTWVEVDRHFERYLKNRKAAGRRYCPVCRQESEGLRVLEACASFRTGG